MLAFFQPARYVPSATIGKNDPVLFTGCFRENP